MIYKVLVSFKIRSSKGEDEIQPGQLVRLSEKTAKDLLAKGKIKPFCYWLETVVDQCKMPCFEIDAMTIVYECPHFKAFWAKRLKEIERKCNVNR